MQLNADEQVARWGGSLRLRVRSGTRSELALESPRGR